MELIIMKVGYKLIFQSFSLNAYIISFLHSVEVPLTRCSPAGHIVAWSVAGF